MHTNMNDKNIDELINKALQEEQALPEGLSCQAGRADRRLDCHRGKEDSVIDP